MTETPLVTAILPAWNAEAFIDETLAALAAQTWPRLEILAADDASTDGTRARLEAFAAGRDDVRLVLRDRNLGWVDNTNDLMARAQGEFLFFAFHDDWVAPTYVERLARELIARPDAVLAYSDLEQFEVDATEGSVMTWDPPPPGASAAGRVLHVARRHGWWHVPNRGLFRAGAFRAIGGMRRHAAGEYSADWPWLLRLSEHGAFVRVPEVLCRKRFMRRSLSVTWDHGAAVQAALLEGGADAIRAMAFDPVRRAALLTALRLAHPRDAGGWSARLPGRVRARLLRGIGRAFGV